MKAPRVLLVVALFMAGCSQSTVSSPNDATKAREEAAFSALKAQYKPVIQGVDANGTTLDVFVDNDQLLSMDEPVEDQMKAQALALWQKTWKSNHPGKHAKVRVRLRNYFGEVLFTESSS